MAKNTINEIRAGAHYLSGDVGHTRAMHSLNKDLRSGKLDNPDLINKRVGTFIGEHKQNQKNMIWQPGKDKKK